MDPADGLLYAGRTGRATYLDGCQGRRLGGDAAHRQAVEVNALWINALETMAEFARLLAKPGEGYEKLSAKAQKSFQKFWNAERGAAST